jgi:hypothetical protein
MTMIMMMDMDFKIRCGEAGNKLLLLLLLFSHLFEVTDKSGVECERSKLPINPVTRESNAGP